ncbi:MAG: hypothetical protein JEY79_06250 [Pseudodesulfovibrio sp.]|nr:hypothetical protein [Pseudodesulfovibrio sp.]
MTRAVLLCVFSVLCPLLMSIASYAGSDVGVVDYFRAKKRKMDNLGLVLKYSDSTNQPAILPGQPFSISLSTGFIGKFMEYGSTGEIAIVARISERASGSLGLRYGEGAADSGRLIYFSNDVEKEQPYNFSYIPVYGPLIYNGRPMDIQLYVFEIDNVEQFKPMLQTLTVAGQKAYPPASPVLGLLNTLGSTLLTAAKNDKMMEYSLCLWPSSPVGNLPGFQRGEFPALEAGHYVFMRRQDRKYDICALNNYLELSSGDHRLRWNSKAKDNEAFNKNKGLYTDDSYLVLHVKRETYALSLDAENRFYKSFGVFKDEEQIADAKFSEMINEELQDLGSDFIRTKRRKDLYILYTGVGAATKGDEAYARDYCTKLLMGLKNNIQEINNCDEGNGVTVDSKICSGVLSVVDIDELLVLMKSTTAFRNDKDALALDKLAKMSAEDISKIVQSVSESLPHMLTVPAPK